MYSKFNSKINIIKKIYSIKLPIYNTVRQFKLNCNTILLAQNRNIRTSKVRYLPNIKVTVFLTISGLFTYDGIKNEFLYTKAAQRFLRSISVALQITKDYFFVLRKEKEDNFDELLKEVHQKSANKILKACLINGGLYIKVGQGVAAINHILPEEYIKILSKLQDECLPYDKKDVQNVFLKDFGKLPEEIYDEFNYKPIAAASLAQVFKAKINGENIAVKVQYDDLQRRFPSDLGTIIFLQDIVEIVFKNYNFGWILKDIRKNLEQEMDFLNEARNSEKCFNDLKKQFNYVHVPKVYWNYTKKRVLTMEWIDAYKINDLEKLKSLKIDIYDLDVKLFNVFAEQIFSTGFVHADPHPGNIFFRKTQSGKTEIILLDHGLYEYLPESVTIPLSEFWEATVLKDEQEMEKCALKLAINDYKNFAEVLFQIPYQTDGEIKSKLTEEDIKYMQSVAKAHFEKVMDTLKEMPRNLLFTVRNLNTVRAISREHGDPVDRPKVMARYAQKCIYRNENSIVGYFKWLWRRFKFEYCFMKKKFKLSIICLYIDILHIIGRSAESCNSLFKKVDPNQVVE